MVEKLKGSMGASFGFSTASDDVPPEVPEGPVFPLRILCVTALVPRGEHNAGAAAPSTPIRVDPKEPDVLFERLKIRASIDVPSVLVPGKKERVEVAPPSLKGFRPDALVDQVGLLARLRDGRGVAAAAAAGDTDTARARVELERLWGRVDLVDEVLGTSAGPSAASSASVPVAPSPAASDDVDALLSMVDMGDGDATAPSPATDQVGTAMREILRQVTGGKKAPRGLQGATARADAALGAQIVAVLHHEEIRRLEKSHRSIRLLAERSAGIPGVILDVLDPGSEAVDAVVGRALASARDPYAFVITDEVVDGTQRSLDLLGRLADHGEAHATPVLVSSAASFLGLDDMRQLDGIDNKKALFDAPARAPWRSLAFRPALQWVAIATNDVLLRGRYDTASSRLRGIAFEEPSSPPLTLGSAWVLALLAVSSFRDTGFPSRIASARAGLVPDLPVHDVDDHGSTVAVPTLAFLSTETQKEVARLGLVAVSAAPNTDAAYVHVAPTAYVVPPKKTYDSATTEPEHRPPAVALGDQLFVAHVVHYVRALAARVTDDIADGEAAELLEQALPLLFDKAPPSGPQASVRVRRDTDGRVAEVRLAPRRFAGVTLEEVAFEMPLG